MADRTYRRGPPLIPALPISRKQPGERYTPAELAARDAALRRNARRLPLREGNFSQIGRVSDMRIGWTGVGASKDL